MAKKTVSNTSDGKRIRVIISGVAPEIKVARFELTELGNTDYSFLAWVDHFTAPIYSSPCFPGAQADSIGTVS